MKIIPVLISFILLNFISFCITAYDKYKAKRSLWRTRERVFLILSFLGGGTGVLCAFYWCRHKTRKRSLLAGVWILTIVSFCILFLIWKFGVK